MPKVLVVPLGKEPVTENMPPGLEAMQAAVGGYIENVTLEEGIGLICNEEGLLTNLPPNRFLEETGGPIRGVFFISRYNDDGETVDLTDKDIKKYTERFALAK